MFSGPGHVEPGHGRCKLHTRTKLQLGGKAFYVLGGIMLYPHKIRILKLTDAGFHVLIPAPAILDRIESLILSLGFPHLASLG